MKVHLIHYAEKDCRPVTYCKRWSRIQMMVHKKIWESVDGKHRCKICQRQYEKSRRLV